MKVKYLIYFFTFCLMTSFAIFILNGIYEARSGYVQSQENLYKISRSKELSEAFQATLNAHRTKRLSLINEGVTEPQWEYAEEQARNKIAIVRSHIGSDISQRLGVRQKFSILSMLSLMEKLLDNDSRQISQTTIANTELFNINSSYYIARTNRTFYHYAYDTRMINADSFLFLEVVHFNNRMNMALTELIDQIIDVKINELYRKDSYLKAIQLTGVLNSLDSRLDFLKLAYNDRQITDLADSMLQQISKDKIDEISQDLQQSITHQTEYDAGFIYQYAQHVSQLSQRLYQRSAELEITVSRNKMYDNQTAIYGTISLGWLIALFILLPTLIFCSNINRWLTKTHNNILRLSQGDMNIENNDAFYGKELIAINNAITRLKQYNQEKIELENEKHDLIKELEASSYLDPLTDIYNRRKFFLQAEPMSIGNHPLAFCLIDIDNFKRLNDTYGHDVGDRVLVMFAQLLRNTFRSSDIFCRYGGEEFAVLLTHCTLDNARSVMEKLREQNNLLSLTLADGKTVRFTISCGIAPVTGFQQLHTAIKQADEALYFCKKSGKDKVSIYTPDGFI